MAFDAEQPGSWRSLFVHGLALMREAQWMVRHRDAFLDQISGRRVARLKTFNAITRLPNPKVVVPSYDECAVMAKEFLMSI